MNQIRPNPELQPWCIKENLSEKDKERSKIYKAFSAGEGAHQNYEREPPAHFSEGRDDRLMHSLITQYALEGNTDGKPNGHFYMTKDQTQRVTDEVVGTHWGFTGAQK